MLWSGFRVTLPAQIDGYPVKKVAAYTFSARKSQEDEDVLTYESEDGLLLEENNKLLAGVDVEKVIFPETVEEIGNYIFYGCKELRYLEFSNTLMSIGSGAFTGCGKLSGLKVHMKRGEKSCVKEILGDLWQRIDVTFIYEEAGKEARLVFPEHYEEAVEIHRQEFCLHNIMERAIIIDSVSIIRKWIIENMMSCLFWQKHRINKKYWSIWCLTG